MYSISTIKDVVRVPPSEFGKDKQTVIENVLRKRYEGRLDKDLGIILVVSDVRDIMGGVIIPGDGGVYYDVVFDTLTYQPKLQEVVRGEVMDVTEYGAFVRMGPLDGLVHVSQVTDDFISFDPKNAVLSGKESSKVLKKGDTVIAKIVTLSLKGTVAESKIGLTMRQFGLGKDEWVEKAKKKAKEKKTEAEKKPEEVKKKGGKK